MSTGSGKVSMPKESKQTGHETAQQKARSEAAQVTVPGAMDARKPTKVEFRLPSLSARHAGLSRIPTH
jgi:hypothetical protein